MENKIKFVLILLCVYMLGLSTQRMYYMATLPTLSPDDQALLTVTETSEFKALVTNAALAIYSKRMAVKLSEQAQGFDARKNYNLDVLDYKLAEMLAK